MRCFCVSFRTAAILLLISAESTIVAAEEKPTVTRVAAPKPLSDGAVTHDWPSFLGPTHNAISSETHLLKSWGDHGPKLVWEMEIGEGFASPAVVGDRLVFVHRRGGEAVVDCVHAETGDPRWRFTYPTDYTDKYGFNGGPRSSPVVHDGLVYTHGVEGIMHCLKLGDGAVVWKRNLSAAYDVPQDYFGVGSTPLIESDRLIVNLGAPSGPTVLALNLKTGETVWEAGGEWTAGYASPIPATVHGKRRVFVFAGGESKPPAGGLMVIDPATGAVDARFPFRSDDFISTNASSPVVLGDRVFISSCYDTGGVMLTLDSGGACSEAWRTDFGTHWMTPVHADGHLYGFDGRKQADAALMCINVERGETVWREALEWEETIGGKAVTMGPMRGSLLRADGQFLCLGETGDLSWLALSPNGAKVLSRARLFYASETYGLPVLSRGLLYVVQTRKDSLSGKPPRLLCYDLRAP